MMLYFLLSIFKYSEKFKRGIVYYIYPDIYFFCCSSFIPSGIISFLFKELPLVILLGQVCGKQIIFVFFIENVFISSSSLKDAFAGCRILGCQFFSFNPLKIPFHFLLAFMFSDTRYVQC